MYKIYFRTRLSENECNYLLHLGAIKKDALSDSFYLRLEERDYFELMRSLHLSATVLFDTIESTNFINDIDIYLHFLDNHDRLVSILIALYKAERFDEYV